VFTGNYLLPINFVQTSIDIGNRVFIMVNDGIDVLMVIVVTIIVIADNDGLVKLVNVIIVVILFLIFFITLKTWYYSRCYRLVVEARLVAARLVVARLLPTRLLSALL
jgi:hypothetical protein